MRVFYELCHLVVVLARTTYCVMIPRDTGADTFGFCTCLDCMHITINDAVF
jgi:hypothetical protein